MANPNVDTRALLLYSHDRIVFGFFAVACPSDYYALCCAMPKERP